FAFDDNHGMIRKDIVASGFYFLSCWREYVLGNQGKDRFDYNKSVQKYWDFIETPVVDVYCEILQKMLELFLVEFMRITTWEHDKRFAVSVSHDIDYWNFWTREHQNFVVRYNLNRLFKQPLNALYKVFSHTIDKNIANDPFQKMNQIVNRETKKGIISTNFLLTKTDFPDQRMNYFGDPQYKTDIEKLLKNNDVALHGSQESAMDKETLKKEWLALKEAGYNAIGYRAHSLTFNYQKSFQILEEIGINYDATLGYWEHIGYRAGISFPFYPYNIAENRPFRVLEIPLIVMDTTLLSAKAMNLTVIQAYRRIKRLIRRANLFKSHVSILWHNTTFDPIDFPGWGPLYWKIIREVKRQGGWLCSLRQVYEYWLK
ncbi:MAG TPA: polysaccharide deacetylase family protein, partial [Candidatus Cloacimonadota bacterium]|nr:polysaccharide deacetylase family protein [Candidatus Cloacimonadota bacterium]